MTPDQAQLAYDPWVCQQLGHVLSVAQGLMGLQIVLMVGILLMLIAISHSNDILHTP